MCCRGEMSYKEKKEGEIQTPFSNNPIFYTYF
jgi:hypothetical protein